MNIYFTEVFRLVHHFTCIYTSSWISHTSDSHKSFNIDIYISFVLPAVRASFNQGLYFWFRVFKVIIPVYQYITKFFLRFSTLATGTLRSWSARHQFDACASRWCPTDANPSVPMVRAISTFSFVLKEETSYSRHAIDSCPFPSMTIRPPIPEKQSDLENSRSKVKVKGQGQGQRYPSQCSIQLTHFLFVSFQLDQPYLRYGK